jgi:inner membrane protein
MSYPVWAVVGIALIITELVTPSFFLVFFGIGALLTALATATGLTASLSYQLIVFCTSSLALMIAFRHKIKFRSAKETLPPDYMGQRVKVIRTIRKGDEGKVFYRGAEWIAFGESPGEEMAEGSLVEVTGADGVRLKVRRIGEQ